MVDSLGPVPATVNFLKCMIGLGILELPWAVSQVGLVAATVGLLFLAFCNAHGILLLVRASIKELFVVFRSHGLTSRWSAPRSRAPSWRGAHRMPRSGQHPRATRTEPVPGRPCRAAL